MRGKKTGRKDGLKIGQVAKACKVATSAIRFYESEGLIESPERGEDNGYRYYDESQVCQIRALTALIRAGVSLDQLKEVMVDPCPFRARCLLNEKEAVLREALEVIGSIRETLPEENGESTPRAGQNDLAVEAETS